MASTIVTKNSSTASAVPLTGDLTQGELAVNVTDKRLFTKDSGGTVVEVGTNPSSVTVKTTLKLSGSSSGYVSFQGAAAAGSTTYTLPSADGTSGQALVTNGSGTLSFATISTAAATPTVLGTVYGKMTTSGASPYLTALGYNAGASSTGVSNTAVGVSALYTNSAGTHNTAIGYNAGYSLTGDYSTLIGKSAGAGYGATAYATHVGYLAGPAGASTGVRNTSVGASSLASVTGDYNTAMGFQTLASNTTASNNTAVGYQAGYSNTTGATITAFGYKAGYSNTTGTDNVAIGDSALYSNSTSANNTAVGRYSLYNTTASGSTAVGYNSLYTNSTGANNVAIGTSALYSNTTANENTAVGSTALFSNTTGNLHVAVGRESLYSNTTGIYNTAIGWNSLYSNTTGSSNVAVGMRAGNSGTNNLTTGSNNTLLGYYAASASASGTYQVVIGSEVTSQNSGGYVTIGDYSAKIYCYYRGGATWTQTSDASMKNVIGQDTLGLSFINRLNPVKFTWKDVGDLPENHPRYNKKGGGDSSTVIHGFIAQDVKAAMDAEGCSTFNGWDQGPDGIQAISREMFISPLVKAVQELSAQVESLKAELATLKGN